MNEKKVSELLVRFMESFSDEEKADIMDMEDENLEISRMRQSQTKKKKSKDVSDTKK